MPSPLFLRSVANTKREREREIAEIIDSYLHYRRNGGGCEVANLNVSAIETDFVRYVSEPRVILKRS